MSHQKKRISQTKVSKRRFRFPDDIDPEDPRGGAPDPQDVDVVARNFERYKARGEASEDLDRDDIEYIGRYLLQPPVENGTWDAIVGWRETGYAVLKHEARELQLLLDNGVNPLDPADVEANYEVWADAHARALIAENDYLFSLLNAVNPEITFGDVVVANPNGGQHVDLNHILAYSDEEGRRGRKMETTFQGRFRAGLLFDQIRG